MNATLSAEEIGTRWFQEVWNGRDDSLISELMRPDAVGHLEGGETIQGPEGFLAYREAILGAFPDMEIEILNKLSDDTHVCLMWHAKGHHTGEGMGLVPTGKEVEIRGTTWIRVEDGKILEGWDCWNQGGLMAKLLEESTVAS